MIRVPREFNALIRAAITLITTIQRKRVIATVISVNGSARTAKLTAMRELRQSLRRDLQRQSADGEEQLDQKHLDGVVRELEERLDTIRNID